MRVSGEPVAAQIMLKRGHALIGYFAAFDPDYAAYSPGRLEMHRLVEWMIGNGITEYDFLGNAESYKESITNASVDLWSVKRPLTIAGAMAMKTMLCDARALAKESFYRLPVSGRRNLIALVQALTRRRTEQASL